jgi:hypothetical protein
MSPTLAQIYNLLNITSQRWTPLFLLQTFNSGTGTAYLSGGPEFTHGF